MTGFAGPRKDTFRLLWKGDGLRVGSWRCADHPPRAPAAGERAPSFEVAFPRAGLYVKRGRHGSAVADPTVAVFFDAGEEYEIEHPIGGGDVSTVVLLEGAAVAALQEAADAGTAPSFRRPAAPLEPAGYWLAGRLARWLEGSPSDRRRTADRGATGRAATEADPLAPDPLVLEETLVHLLLRTIPRADGSADAGGGGRCASRGGSGTGSSPGAATRRHRRLAVRRTREYIASHLHAPVRLDEVAEAAGYSKYHLCRVFKERVGLPIGRWATRLRLRAALEAIWDPEADLSRVAFSFGFSSHSHLSAAFRREFGISPSRARAEASLSELRSLADLLASTRRDAGA